MTGIGLRGVGNRVLRQVDLAVRPGELFVLLGPSGAGKTSLLNVVAGLMPHRGQVLFDGVEVNRLPPQERRVGYLFQDLMLFPHLSVRGNLELALRGREGNRDGAAERIARLLDLLKIGHLASRRPAGLSGGEGQRVALARALASSPRILLLDEPFNNLDFRSARHLRRELRQVQRELGLTTLFVTHNLEEAEEIADRMAVISEGRLAEVGSAADLLQNHDCGDASFLERSNRLICRGKRPAGNGLLEVDCAGLSLLAADPGRDIQALSVLPSRVMLGREPPPGPEVNRFRARVVRVVENQAVWHVQLDAGGVPLVSDVPMDRFERADLSPGREVHVLIGLLDLNVL